MGVAPVTVALVAALLVVLVVAAFALQNQAPVALQFLAWSWQWDVGRLVGASVVAGALTAFLVLGFDDLRLRLRLHQAVRRVARLESRLASLESERDRLVERLQQASRGIAEAAAGMGPEDIPPGLDGPGAEPGARRGR